MMNNVYNNQSQHGFKEMDTAEKIMWRSGQFSLPESLPKEDAYSKLRKRIADADTHATAKVVRLPARYFMAAAVVGLLFLVGSWFVWTHVGYEDIIAAKGQQTDFRLPDGSIVSLNADTKISFHKSNFMNKRNVKMDGEAFFNIEKGSTFTIATELAEIKILGTSFNVLTRGNYFKLSCFTGKVLVTSGSQSLVVSPMEIAVIKNDKLILLPNEDIYLTTAWRTGEFRFENTALNLVFDEIERQYNVTFVLPNMDSLFFTGSFSNKNLVEALDIVCIPMELTYEIGSNSKILIKNKTE